MATLITAVRTTTRREIPPATARSRPLIVTLRPEGLYLREKGRRTSYLLPWGRAYVQAARLAADAKVAAKRAAAKERRQSSSRRK